LRNLVQRKSFKLLEERIDLGVFPKKSKILKEMTILFSTFDKLQKLINKNLYRLFLKLLIFKANWEKPIPRLKAKRIIFYLKNGQQVQMIRSNKIPNFLWKYSSLLKFYFYKFLIISQRKKIKELESMSNKWRVEDC
jgi:hypothetical protein